MKTVAYIGIGILCILVILIIIVTFILKKNKEEFRNFYERDGVVRNLNELKEWAGSQGSSLNNYCNNATKLNEGQYCHANCAQQWGQNGWKPGRKIIQAKNGTFKVEGVDHPFYNTSLGKVMPRNFTMADYCGTN